MRPILCLLLIAACKSTGPEPSPLGTLGAEELKAWRAECSTPLVETRVCGRFTPDKCDGHFHTIMPQHAALTENEPASSATLKRTCASEGWGIWTDELDRVVALCVAGAPGVANTVRLEQFVERHRGKALAKKVDDFTAGRNRDDSESGWGDWYDFNMIPKPPEMGQQQCIEFRLLK